MRYAIGIVDMLRAKLTEKDAAIKKLTALLLKAEQALALRGEPVAWAHKDHLENALVIVNRVKKVWEELKIDNAENYTIPLYAAPISGERDE